MWLVVMDVLFVLAVGRSFLCISFELLVFVREVFLVVFGSEEIIFRFR